MTEAYKEVYVIIPNLKALVFDNSILLLKCMSCIYYPIQFKKDQARIQALLDCSRKINAIILAYAVKLGFKV